MDSAGTLVSSDEMRVLIFMWHSLSILVRGRSCVPAVGESADVGRSRSWIGQCVNASLVQQVPAPDQGQKPEGQNGTWSGVRVLNAEKRGHAPKVCRFGWRTNMDARGDEECHGHGMTGETKGVVDEKCSKDLPETGVDATREREVQSLERGINEGMSKKKL